MTAPTSPTVAREVDWRRVTQGVLLGVIGTALAVAFKSRCGIPVGLEEALLRTCYTDVTPLWLAERLDQGAIPYLDHAVEYPPLTGLWMWLAAVGAGSGGVFFMRTMGLLVLSGGAIGGLLAHTVGLRRTLVFAAAPTLVVSGAINWDLPSMALAVAGLVAHRRGRDGWAGVWLGLGTAAKLWPVLLVLPVALAAVALRGRGAGLRAAGGAAGAWLAINVPVMVAAPSGWARFLELSRERGPTTSSLWRLVPDLLGGEVAVSTINLASGVVTVVGVLVLVALAVRWDPPERWHLVGLPVVALFLLASKVYSPQFSLWLLPLLALATPPVWTLVVFAIADVAVNLTLFPYIARFSGIEGAGPVEPLNVALAIRAVAIVAIAIWGWRRWAHAPPLSPSRQPTPAVTT